MSADRSLGRLALATGLWPILAVHVAYLISAQAGLVPWCFVYGEGCTSISRAARHGLANLWFKLTMLPYCWLLIAYWWRAAQLSAARRLRWVWRLGLVGALFLAIYVGALGVEGELYQWMRRYGITVYFSFTVLALMLLASVFARKARLLTALCAVMLLLGLASLPLQHMAGDHDAAVNALEWTYALLMMLGFVATTRLRPETRD